MKLLEGLPYKVVTGMLDSAFFSCVALGLLMKFLGSLEVGHTVVLFAIGGLSFALRVALWILKEEREEI